MKEEQKLTIEALKYYIPIFQMGDYALNQLYLTTLSPSERNKFETIAGLRELATRKITYLGKPLLIREINKIISSSHLRYTDEGLFNLLFYAGVNGLIKGLKKFDINKIEKSSTNYLIQWFLIYAKRELLVQEAAPFNIPPSRFGIYKKISAVRKRLSEILERPAKNEEIYEYFQEGKAEIKTMNGPVKKTNQKVSKANQKITIELIKEQEEYEEKFNYIYLIDPIENNKDLTSNNNPHKNMNEFFDETIFGVFLEQYNFTKNANLVLKSMLNIDGDKKNNIKNIPKTEYKKTEKSWHNLLTDINGPFYEFLIKINNEGYSNFNIEETIKKIETSNKKIYKTEYLNLFEGEKIEIY